MEIASSQVISSTRNSDLGRCSSIKPSSVSEIHLPQNCANNITSNSAANRSQFQKNSPPMTVDGLLRNMYGEIPISETSFLDTEITLIDPTNSFPIDNPRSIPLPPSIAHKSVEDVWKEIVNGESERKECKQEVCDEMMTLEDFLAKAGAIEEEDVKVSEKVSGGIFSFDPLQPSPYLAQQAEGSALGFANGVEVTGGRCKRKALLEPLDKAAQQRQRRMIKNRESAARSRERKQAYQFELESLAARLEEENAQLMKEKEERRRERLKQLMEKVVPVLVKRRPPRILRRSNSMDW